MVDDPIARLTVLIEDHYRRLNSRCREGGDGRLRIRIKFDSIEARDFLAGFDAGLFKIGKDGYVQSEFLPAARTGQDKQRILQLFWTGRPFFLFREGICQLAAASALVLRYGWRKEQVYQEPNKTILGKAAWGVDLAVSRYMTGDKDWYICAEMKTVKRDLDKMLAELGECGRRGEHTKTDCVNKQHSKYEACRQLRPSFFWAVCPGVRKAFSVHFDGDVMALTGVDDIPHAGQTPSPRP